MWASEAPHWQLLTVVRWRAKPPTQQLMGNVCAAASILLHKLIISIFSAPPPPSPLALIHQLWATPIPAGMPFRHASRCTAMNSREGACRSVPWKCKRHAVPWRPCWAQSSGAVRPTAAALFLSMEWKAAPATAGIHRE